MKISNADAILRHIVPQLPELRLIEVRPDAANPNNKMLCCEIVGTNLGVMFIVEKHVDPDEYLALSKVRARCYVDKDGNVSEHSVLCRLWVGANFCTCKDRKMEVT